MTTKKESLEGITKDIVSSKIIGNNTLEINYKDGSRAIRLHNTDVITFFKNGSFLLNSGGWRTPTTKDRINKHASVYVSQKNNIWYINNDIIFFDGIRFKADGSLIGKPRKDPTIKVNKIKKQIKNFVSLIDSLKEIPQPNNGDCWHCLFKDKNGQTMGDLSKSTDHLKQHIKQKYIHGSLLVNAMLHAGYRKESIGYHYQLKNKYAFKHALQRYLTDKLLKDVL